MQAMPPQPLSARHYISLAALLVVGAALAAPGLKLPLYPDAVNMYLPLARRLLEEGVGAFARPESVMVGPFSFVYPALLGANETVIRWANMALFGGAAALVFHAVRIMHSNRAGLIAAAFVALSPIVRTYIPNVLSEPPFLFLMAAWMAALASVIRRQHLAAVIAGGVGMALAVLTRPSAMYLPAAIAVVFALRAWKMRGSERRIDLYIVATHALALAVVIAWIARNAVVFGFPAVAAGAGNALFGGVNAMVDGFDPSYYGLSFDEGSITGPQVSHVSIAGDRILRQSAMAQLAITPWPVLGKIAARKAVAFLFVPGTEAGVVCMRTWRSALLILAVAAVAWHWRSRFVFALALTTAYFIAVHLPVLYHHRYSIVIDLPLAALGAIGFAECMRSRARIGLLVFAIVFSAAVSVMLLRNTGPGAPHLEHAALDPVWSAPRAPMQRVARGQPIEITVANAPKFHPWNHYVLVMDIAVAPVRRGDPCTGLRFHYKGAADANYSPWRTARIPLVADGVRRRIPVGVAYPLGLSHEGTLRIDLDCAGDAVLDLGPLEILSPRRATLVRLSEQAAKREKKQ